MLHQDLICEEPVLADNINPAFVNIMKDYQPLTDSVRVSVEDDEPITVTEELVEKKLRASGPYELPNWVLKEYSDILAAPITVILNSSFVECRVPRVCYAECDKTSSPLKIKQVTQFTIKLPTISINLFVDQITFPSIYVTSLVVQFIY